MLPVWIKALHLIFMVTWFAGLFYLPRLFIYHVEATDLPADARFQVMEKKLYVLMTIGATLTVLFGVWMLMTPQFAGTLAQGWFQAKLILLVGMFIYHGWCWRWIVRLRRGFRPSNTRGLRWFNEIPVAFLFGIIILAVVRPF